MNVMPINIKFAEFKQIIPPTVELSSSDEVNSTISFKALLANQLERVNNSQNNANQMAADFENGSDIDIPTLMISEQQAELSFSALVETRNRLLRSYQEIMHMQI